jgi:hypothetical protein
LITKKEEKEEGGRRGAAVLTGRVFPYYPPNLTGAFPVSSQNLTGYSHIIPRFNRGIPVLSPNLTGCSPYSPRFPDIRGIFPCFPHLVGDLFFSIDEKGTRGYNTGEMKLTRFIISQQNPVSSRLTGFFLILLIR